MKRAFLKFLICGILIFGAVISANAQKFATVADTTSQQGIDTSNVVLSDSTYTLSDSTNQVNYEEINKCNAQSIKVFKYMMIFYVSWFVILILSILATLYYLWRKKKKLQGKGNPPFEL